MSGYREDKSRGHVRSRLECLMWMTLLTGLKLNAVVMVNLIMSMGIAVEFLSHIARAFMMEQGTRAARAAAAVRSLGAATVNGAVTTFLGILPIAFSYYKVGHPHFSARRRRLPL